MKKIVKGMVICFGLLVFTGCNKASASGDEEKLEEKIIVASHGSDAEIWQYIAKSEAAKEAGLNIEVRDITGGAIINQATVDGDIDVSAFQSIGYLDSFNAESSEKLSAIAATYVEPMGLYSEKIKSLAEIPEGATVAIGNDPASSVRSLRLLEKSGLIKLATDFDNGLGTPEDIIENPKNLKISEVDEANGARILPDVDLVIIGNTFALEGGLNVLEDSIFHEEADTALRATVNVLVVKEERKNEADLIKLGELYHDAGVQAYIADKFDGTKVEITKPISEFWTE